MIKYRVRIKRKEGSWQLLETENNLISMSCEMFERYDFSLPSYGIISNKGKISLVFDDKYHDFNYYYKNYILNHKFIAEIYIDNTLSLFKSDDIATMDCTEWDYDEDTHILNISLNDDLIEWQNITDVEGLPIKITYNAYEVYEFLKSITPSEYNLELGTNASSYLKETTLPYFFIKKSNLWDMWQNFCVSMGLHIYKNQKGDVFVQKWQ
jgi:hypothetical protein